MLLIIIFFKSHPTHLNNIYIRECLVKYLFELQTMYYNNNMVHILEMQFYLQSH